MREKSLIVKMLEAKGYTPDPLITDGVAYWRHPRRDDMVVSVVNGIWEVVRDGQSIKRGTLANQRLEILLAVR